MGDPVIDAMNQMVSELGEPDLEATGLVKVYGDRTVVNGMNVNCRCGEFYFCISLHYDSLILFNRLF